MWLSILINSDISHSKYLHKSSIYLNDIDDVSPFMILFKFLLVIFIFWHSQYLDLFFFFGRGNGYFNYQDAGWCSYASTPSWENGFRSVLVSQ